jgi:hypothetical protein
MNLQTALRGTLATIAVPVAMTTVLELNSERIARRSAAFSDPGALHAIDLMEVLRLTPVHGIAAAAATSNSAVVTDRTGPAPELANAKALEDVALVDWLTKPLVQIVELSLLPPADLPGEEPIRQASIASAVNALIDLHVAKGPAPQIVARGDGGVQFIWYTPTRDLEIEVGANGKLKIVEFDGKATKRIPYASAEAAAALERISDVLKT